MPPEPTFPEPDWILIAPLASRTEEPEDKEISPDEPVALSAVEIATEPLELLALTPELMATFPPEETPSVTLPPEIDRVPAAALLDPTFTLISPELPLEESPDATITDPEALETESPEETVTVPLAPIAACADPMDTLPLSPSDDFPELTDTLPPVLTAAPASNTTAAPLDEEDPALIDTVPADAPEPD